MERVIKMSNSPLVSYTKLSPNFSSRNGTKITKITPHHMAGVLSVETCGNVFASSARQASSNYGIGNDGRIALYVDESNRAWTSKNAANDRAAVTIEVSNSATGGDWPVSDAAWKSLVNLCVDICQRNGIKGLTWTGGSDGSLTCHYMFAATNCPGPYLKSRMGQLANEVNAKLNNGYKPQAPSTGGSSTSTPKPSTNTSSNGAHTSSSFGGKYRCTVNSLNIRNKPSMSGAVVGQYTKGKTVILDNTYYIADGYVWGTYIANSGNRRYIAVGKHTGKPEKNDYLVKV